MSHILDIVSNSVHHAIDIASPVYALYRSFILLQFAGGHGPLLLQFCNAINSATRVKASQKDKKPLYWLYSLFLVIFTGFGGGTLAPIMIGKPPVIVSNDTIVPVCIVCWYATHYLGLQSFFTLPPIQLIWTIGAQLFRMHTCCNIISMAMVVLVPGPYYAIPLTGPIVVGTALGSFSLFIPLDKGFSPIANSTPWVLQSAFLSAAFYHLMVNDTTGIFGNTLRLLVGSYTENDTRIIIATFLIVNGLIHYFFGPDANILTPLHKVLYLITQVDGPSGVTQKPNTTVGWNYPIRIVLERWLEFGRILFVIVLVGFHIYMTVPRTTLTVTSAIPIYDNWEKSKSQPLLGHCILLPKVRGCSPYVMTTPVPGPNAAFSVYSKLSPDIETDRIWSLPVNLPASVWETSGNNGGGIVVRIGGDGALRVVSLSGEKEKTETALWTSRSHCEKIEGGAVKVPDEVYPYLQLNSSTGYPEIVCPGGGGAVLLVG